MTIPRDLIYEILCRVPVKYLLRCRCVAKRWCSLLDNTDFVKKHSRASTECGGIVIRACNKLYLADYESLHAGNAVATQTDGRSDYFLTVDDSQLFYSANGLVCCTQSNKNIVVIFNPSTRKSVKLPVLPFDWQISFDCCSEHLSGFGYDHVNDEYKIVRIALLSSTLVIVYSLKTNSWKHIDNVCFSKDIQFQDRRGRFACGALYWPATDTKGEHGCSVIVRYDLGLEQFGVFAASFEGKGPINLERLIAFEGGLHVSEYNSSGVDVSQINDYAMKTLNFSVSLDEKYGGPAIRPLAYSKSREEVLVQVDCERLVWYNLESKATRNVRIQTAEGVPRFIDSHSYTASLFKFSKRKSPAGSHFI